MQPPDPRYDIVDKTELGRLFEAPREASVVKEIDHIDANYREWIRASPFFALATAGPDGLDCSPRGDAAGFVEVLDSKTLLIPDRRGNNRIDSLRNLLIDPRVALLFLIPGIGETLRVNGRARINADPVVLARFAIGDRVPKLVLVVAVETVFFQCSRALLRSKLWDPTLHVASEALPSPGKVLHDITTGHIDGVKYDKELPDRLKSTLY